MKKRKTAKKKMPLKKKLLIGAAAVLGFIVLVYGVYFLLTYVGSKSVIHKG